MSIDGKFSAVVPVPPGEKLELFRTQWLNAYVDEMDKGKEFHKAVFGLQEIAHFTYTDPDRRSASLQFGASVEEAKLQTGPRFGVTYRPKDASPDPIIRLVLNVTQIQAMKDKIVKHGGTILSGPIVNARGIAITIFKDPVGNLVELRSLPPGRPLKNRQPTAEVCGMRVTVTAADRDKTIAYYNAMFSMHVTATYNEGGAQETVLQIGKTVEDARNGNSTQLLLKTVDKFVKPSLFEPITSQICFSVGKDIEQLLKKSAEVGGKTYQEAMLMPTSNTVGRIQDPSGNIIELLRPPGYDG